MSDPQQPFPWVPPMQSTPTPQVPPMSQQQPQQIPGPQPAAAPPAGLPTIYRVDDALIQQAQELAAKEAARMAGRGGNSRFLDFPPPPGLDTWAKATKGMKVTLHLRLLPPWAQGVLPYQQDATHFWKSQRAPKGTTVTCLGKGVCPVCQARDGLFRLGSEAASAHAKANGRPRTTYYWNVLVLDWPERHVDETGAMAPFIFRASSDLHGKFMAILSERGGMNAVLDPTAGRSITVTKEKTGSEDMNVAWEAMPDDPAPLHPGYYAALHKLHDLHGLLKKPSQEALVLALREMRLVGDQMPPDVLQLLQQVPSEAQQLAASGVGQLVVGGPAPQGWGAPPVQQFQNPPVQQFQGVPQQPWAGAMPAQGMTQMGQFPPQQPGGYPPPQQFQNPPAPQHPTNPPLQQLQGQMAAPVPPWAGGSR